MHKVHSILEKQNRKFMQHFSQLFTATNNFNLKTRLTRIQVFYVSSFINISIQIKIFISYKAGQKTQRHCELYLIR